MCKEPMILAPLSGCSPAYSSRSAIKPGISCSASSISLRPNATVGADKSATLYGKSLKSGKPVFINVCVDSAVMMTPLFCWFYILRFTNIAKNALIPLVLSNCYLKVQYRNRYTESIKWSSHDYIFIVCLSLFSCTGK